MEVVSLAVGGAGGGLSSGGGGGGGGGAGGGRSAGGAGPAREAAEEGGGDSEAPSRLGSSSSSSSGTGGALRAASAALEQGGGGGGESLEAASSRGTGMLVRRVVQPGKRLACNTCGGVELETAEAHREHHRTDWHRLNCKRKVKALEPLALEAFEALPAAARAALLAADC